ncbi:TonB-dependent receptor [Neotamlana laminarinivorans]|uniref:TonB-dependent receptor n=1 Tax=Neotamlana laminarinivorans TaxID=2883124 RepID=A0A9X1HYL6_9FLAO|nr:TonB-dependent receptor [Tamlana laminarinivorans]MCB4797976.1 TonB-dependent receptor [Tamlana laminarinivorans]
MRKFTQNLLAAVVFLFSAVVMAQSTVTGTIMEAGSNLPLPGANVIEKGTSNGVVTDFDGNFSLATNQPSGELVITFVGYTSKTITFSDGASLGNIYLESSQVGLDEIQIIASVAVDRKTPVAVSTVKAEDIEIKLGTQEFPEILKSTPGVYATKSGGGFGDSRINLRGFESENVAVMINGVPVNDMENGAVYWSNWAGLSDVTRSMQVQRGLGAAKVAVPSIGGTINILTKTTDQEAGGNVTTTIGNAGYFKRGFTLSTGLMDNGWAATASFAKLDGEGYIDGTQFEGYNYFVSIAKKIGENHTLSLTSFGAPQEHGQRQNRSLISKYRSAESGIKFNPDWGYKNGQILNTEDNFYHKSQTSLNHHWDINDNTSLSTAIYASWGRGGGGGTAGENRDLFNLRLGADDQPIDFDSIVEINQENAANGEESEAYLRASINSHNWFGGLSTLKTDLNENLVFLAGLDIRSYRGLHYSEITDLLGGDFVLEDSDVNNPNRIAKVGDKRDYNNDGVVGWQGLFGQLEYSKDKLAGFVSLSLSNTSYKRIDYFQYLDNDPLQETDRYNFMGYMIKGGANYNLDGKNNVFANIGYFEKAPGFDAVFSNFDNELINDDAENQKIFSAELGYGFRSSKFRANVNLYYTRWNDKTDTRSVPGSNGENFVFNLTGVNALHTGIEIDAVYQPIDKLTLTGMLSVGDWKWDDNIENVQIFDEDQNAVGDPINIAMKGLKVGNAAQTTAALSADYNFFDKTYIGLDFNYFGDNYADFDPTGRQYDDVSEIDTAQAWKMPNYTTMDANFRYGFDLLGFDSTIILNVNNIFNTEYIADATDGSGHTYDTALVWYGFGRTYSLGAKFRF